jgi:hypothetical protein
MAHSFIPHHHHSTFVSSSQHCEQEKQNELACCEHNTNEEQANYVEVNCCLEHHKHMHSHTFCSFEEKIVLSKGISLSDLFLPSSAIKHFELVLNYHSFTSVYLPNFIDDPHSPDLQLRGPPQFS